MNKKGFTLIELLSVVTLIVLVSLIVIPNLLSSINKKKSEISSANMQLLSAATDVYIGDHSSTYVNSFEADGSTYCISLQTLINAGILETPFKDISGKEVDYTDVVKAIYNSSRNGFDYTLVKKNQCTEVIQYVNRPVLGNGMIPVIYEDGSWKKADASSKWYNYSEKRWANAVLVREWKGTESGSKSRYEYLEAPYGTVINDVDILGYFVWIPRYRYELFTSSSPVSINVVFESVGTVKSNGNIAGQWLTHPAFTYNGKELSGIWIGKYEASNKDNNILVRPNLTPWTNIGFNDSSSLSNSMTNLGNIYGLSNVNSHLIRNNEWSSVAYLAQSIYGVNTKINVNSSTSTGGTNSTTGNIYGVYDMAGLSKEFVVITGENENSIGYSLSETRSWYSDTNTFIDSTNSYLARGGTSIFNYSASNVKNSSTSFRPVIINNDGVSNEQNTSLQYAYVNNSTGSYYSTLQDALAEVHSGDTIRLLKNYSETSTPVLDSSKNCKIDLAGNELTLSNRISNNGTLDIYSSTDGGVVKSSGTSMFLNNGIFTLNATDNSHTMSIINTSTTTSSAYVILYNYGTTTFNNNVTLKYLNSSTSGTANRYVVLNYGPLVTVNGATIINNVDNKTTEHAIANASTASSSTIVFNSGSISAGGYGIWNNGSTKNTIDDPAVKITGGSISSSMAGAVVNSKTSSMVYVTGGTISGNRGIYNTVAAKIHITGTPTITSTQYQAVRCGNGTAVIEGGISSGPTLNGYTDGVYVATENDVSGSVTIKGYVNIISQTQFGIQAGPGTTVTIGVNDNSVSTTYPYIVANASSGYGVKKSNDTIFEFYDGKIKAVTSHAVNIDPTSVATGYKISKTNADGWQTAILIPN